MAMILDAFMSKFSEHLVQMAQDEAVMLLGVPDEIKKLNNTLGHIRCVLADAEEKKNKNSFIELWLKELKDVMYDADDVMDLCQIKAQERADRSDSSSSSKKGCGFLDLLSCFRNPAFAHEIGMKIKEINSRLEEIAKQKTHLGLLELQNATRQSLISRVNTFITRKTDSIIVLDDLVGEKIEEDARLVVGWLTEEEKGARQKEVCVVAIVGMGGIGKTTLAKRIYNDPQIGDEFELKIWTCVSKEAKGEELLMSIIKQAGGNHGGAQERSVLLNNLRELVLRKKFLLVLDDVWEESQRVWSQLLRDPLMAGDHGSRLLVTTRNESVARGMRAAKMHHVEKLSDDDGWSLLVKQIFQNEEQSETQQFKDIGLQLVKKCDGLPLAIKSTGGLLCTKSKTVGAWQAVLSNTAWTTKELPVDVHQAFYLSYEDLPSPLKQCFITCSLYPEDSIYNKTDLIFRWFAEGFLQDNGNLWELGNECYEELLQRNILEDTDMTYDQGECKMHDLLWSFARYLGKDENLILTEGDSIPQRDFSLKVRRLAVKGVETKTNIVMKEKWLRTLLIDDIPENGLVDLCRNLSSLRILDLRNSNISTLPDSLGDLKHLRYLDVSNSKIKVVPESIGYLRNLVYLDLSSCEELPHIPQSIINLKQLRYLNLYNTNVETIPVGLKNLENLIHLCGFKPDNDNSKGFSSLDELDALSKLIALQLYGLERVSDINIAKRAQLWSKEKLQDLHLICTPSSWTDQLSQTNEKKVSTEGVLNELSPPCSIEIIQIVGYFGNCLPKWLNSGASQLPNLRYLHINNCNCFKNIAPLGQLPNLDWLSIEDAYSIESVGEEFFGTDLSNISLTPAFPKLNKLIFEGLANWKEWKWNKEVAAMSKLKNLFIRKCPQLRSLRKGLSHHATSLENLEINGADNLTTIENFPSVKDIRVFRNPNLERISNLPRVSHILIQDCPNLKVVEKLNDKSLQSMELGDLEMEVLPGYLAMVTSQKLRIWCREAMLQKITSSDEEGESEWHKFAHIAKVKIESWDQPLYAIYHKTTPPSFSFTTYFTEIISSSEDDDAGESATAIEVSGDGDWND